MASEPQAISESLLQNNYISLVAVAVVGYDYILTFSREIDYVWRRKWTWVSTVFVFVRYPGLCWAMLSALIGTIFIPGPVSVSNILFLVSCWEFPVFICAADLVMILRVYTIWNRSRPVLYILLFFYLAQAVVSVVLPAIYNSSPAYFTPSIVQVYDFTVCNGTFSPNTPGLLGVYSAIPRFALSGILLIFAVIRTLRQLFDMYNATKQWQPNRYMSQFTRDGIFYFFISTVYNVVIVATATTTTIVPPLVGNVLSMISVALLCTTMPRFIIAVRELYDRDLRDHWQGIDTGFGVFSQGEKSAIAFAEEGSQTLHGSEDDPDAVQLEPVGEGA